MNEPSRIAVAGDWHGNTFWAGWQIRHMAERLRPDGQPLTILHAGDFGIWPRDDGYLRELDAGLQDAGAELWFVDGNHEEHPRLNQTPDAPHLVTSSAGWPCTRIYHLPRGYRWHWHDRTWVAAGGAVSVDRRMRTPGRSWWPEEEITDDQETAIIAGGPADVVIAHDRPLAAPITLPRSSWPPELIDRSNNHRLRLDRVASALDPKWWIHGHYHTGQPGWEPAHRGFPVRVCALSEDGTNGNWGILDVRTMEWEGAGQWDASERPSTSPARRKPR